MQIRDLEAADAVYRYKSFSEAAYEMNFSLSAISKQVSRVEKELGYEIFEARVKGQPLKTTPEGSIIMPEIHKIVQQYLNLQNIVKGMTNADPIVISLGISPLIGTLGENEILSGFSIQSPEVELNITYDNNTNIVYKLQNRDLDAAFILVTKFSKVSKSVLDSLSEEGFKVIKIMQNDKMHIGISSEHPLAQRSSIRLDDIKNEILILPLSLEESIRKGMVINVQSMLMNNGSKLTPMYMDYTNKDLVLSVVESGKAVFPEIARPMNYNSKIKYISVEDWPIESTGLFVFRKNNNSKHLRSLIKLAKEYAAANMLPADEKQSE